MPDPLFLILAAVEEPTFWTKTVAVAGVAGSSYALGSICFAILFTKWFTGKDIRVLGSGNAGTSNVFRSAGFWPGALTGIFDFAKGVLAVYAGYWLFEWTGFDAYTGGCCAALFVLVGHLYPIFFDYRGGKGVMTVAGILVVLNWRVFLVLITVYTVILIISRITSVAGLGAATLMPITNAIFQIMDEKPWVPTTAYLTLITILIWYTHRDNLKRLKEGRENRATVYVEKDDMKQHIPSGRGTDDPSDRGADAE